MKTYRWCWGVISLVPFVNTNTHFFLADWDDLQARHEGENWIEYFDTPHGWHGMSNTHMNLNFLLEELVRLHCDSEFIRMTRKRGYATLEFKSKEEANFWKDKSCYLVKFQRVHQGCG